MFDKVNSLDQGLDAHVEYGAWMIELVPTKPIFDITKIDSENQMYDSVLTECDKTFGLDQKVLMLPVYPTLGAGDYFTQSEESMKNLPEDKEKL